MKFVERRNVRKARMLVPKMVKSLIILFWLQVNASVFNGNLDHVKE